MAEISYLNRGMYDLVDVARLLARSPATVARWVEPKRNRPALLVPQLGEQLFSFHDLISLQVVSRLSARKVPLTDISTMIRGLEKQLNTDRPLAHERMPELATVGRRVFVEEDDEWIDAGQGGQRAFQELIVRDLRRLEYGADGMASVWHPHDRVTLNPRVQAGSPCIEHTRVGTAHLLALADAGEDVHDLAEDYEVDLDDVLAALDFERRLNSGLAAAA
jgi:uncharacterized protein (DUF433 family)